jgi:pimeloyl-[acyl-carrier protein] methyl ester esterase
MAATTAVLLPGLDGTGELFEPFVRAAPIGIQPVVVDYPIDESSIEVLAQRAQERLTDHSIIVAESFSGPIGIRVAADPRVLALILCNSFIRSPVSPALRHLAIAPLFSIPIPEFLLRSTLLGWEASSVLIEKTQRVIGRIPGGVLACRARQVLQTNEEETLRSLVKPLLYLRGIGDNLVSEKSWLVVQKVRPDAQIAKIEGPHMLLQISPTECWKAILAFIAGFTEHERSPN